MLPCQEICFPWFAALPTEALLRRLQWSVSPDGGVLRRCCWHDVAGHVISFRIGFDGTGLLREWFLLFHRRMALSKCRHVTRNLHRQEPGLAQGAECHLLHTSHLFMLRFTVRRGAALLHGCCHLLLWPLAVRGGIGVYASTCLCGLRMPSRVHLTFHCHATNDLRVGLKPPSSRVEERLLAVEAEEEPPPLLLLAPLELFEERASSLPPLPSSLAVATGGSSESTVVIPALSFAVSTGLGDEDQGPFKAELEALRLLTVDACDCSSLRELHVLVDCQLALDAVRQGGHEYPLLVGAIRSLHASLEHRGIIKVCLHWVPSHGSVSVLSHGSVSARWVHGQAPGLKHNACGMTGWTERSVQLASVDCRAHLEPLSQPQHSVPAFGNSRPCAPALLRGCVWPMLCSSHRSLAARNLHPGVGHPEYPDMNIFRCSASTPPPTCTNLARHCSPVTAEPCTFQQVLSFRNLLVPSSAVLKLSHVLAKELGPLNFSTCQVCVATNVE